MAGIGALMWVGFRTLWQDTEANTRDKVAEIGQYAAAAGPGVGMVSSLAGLLVFLLFLLVATQVLVGLYATSTLRATLYDAASRAADGGVADGAAGPRPGAPGGGGRGVAGRDGRPHRHHARAARTRTATAPGTWWSATRCRSRRGSSPRGSGGWSGSSRSAPRSGCGSSACADRGRSAVVLGLGLPAGEDQQHDQRDAGEEEAEEEPRDRCGALCRPPPGCRWHRRSG